MLLTNIFHLAFHVWAHTEKNKDNQKVDLVNVSISAERVQQPEVSMGSAGCKVHFSAVLVAGGTNCHLQACRRKEPPEGQLAPLAKEILISLPETLQFYIKHIQSVNGRETQSSLVVRTLPMLECYRCCSSKLPVSLDCVKNCQGKAVKTSNAETWKKRH